MKLSQLLKLPNWTGEVYLPDESRNYQLHIADEGNKLYLRHNSATYYIYDQDIEMNQADCLNLHIRPKNPLNRTLPRWNNVMLLDRRGRAIPKSDLDKYLPPDTPKPDYTYLVA